MFKKFICVAVCSSIALITRWYLIGHIYKSKRNLEGKLIIVTGGNSGIGFEVCKELSGKHNATVILTSRNRDSGLKAIAKIQETFPQADIRLELLDLCSFLSVCTFVKKVTQSYSNIYAIVNNAGVFYHKPELTKDGFEVTFQTNYLAPFLLTTNLLSVLQSQKKLNSIKIINVTSQAHEKVTEFPQVDYHLAFPDSTKARFESYSYSKFCLVLWSAKLAEIVQGSENFSVHCVDPGNVETNIFRNFPPLATPLWYFIQKPIRFFLIKTPKEGAQSILYALLDENNIPFYVKNQKTSAYNTLCDNPEYQNRLWQISKKYCSTWIS